MKHLGLLKRSGLVLVLSLLSLHAGATRSYITNATIAQVRGYATDFGLCTIVVNVNVNTAGDRVLACVKTQQVSFDCGGEVGSKTAGNTNFSLAQLAFVTGRTVNIYVDDTEQFNASVCYADRIIINQ